MNVIINGEVCQLAAGATVAHAVRAVTGATHGVAVAVNDQVVSRGAWDVTLMAEGDRVEVLTAVQGG
jgi:sulfur carrier protein